MSPGELVAWKLDRFLGTGEPGMVIRLIPYEERGWDPFPMYEVLFPSRGILRCREIDLCKVDGG